VVAYNFFSKISVSKCIVQQSLNFWGAEKILLTLTSCLLTHFISHAQRSIHNVNKVRMCSQDEYNRTTISNRLLVSFSKFSHSYFNSGRSLKISYGSKNVLSYVFPPITENFCPSLISCYFDPCDVDDIDDSGGCGDKYGKDDDRKEVIMTTCYALIVMKVGAVTVMMIKILVLGEEGEEGKVRMILYVLSVNLIMISRCVVSGS